MRQQSQQFEPASFECREAASNNGMQRTALRAAADRQAVGHLKRDFRMQEVRKVHFCPTCGHRSPQKLIFIHKCSTLDVGWDVERGGEATPFEVLYHVATCETCDELLIYRTTELWDIGLDPRLETYFVDAHRQLNTHLVYPDTRDLEESVPKGIRDIYMEAVRIKDLAPNAFAVQIRRALEALCEDRSAQRGTLQQRLADLSAKGEIPATLSRVSDVLRLLGNIGAHAGDQSVKAWQIHTLDEFFRAIVEYVYVAPSKLKEFTDSMASFNSGRPKANPELKEPSIYGGKELTRQEEKTMKVGDLIKEQGGAIDERQNK